MRYESKMKRISLAVTALLLGGCTVSKTPVPLNTNEPAGVVRLAYSLPPLQTAKVDKFLAQSTASRQCQQWGYASAIPYGSDIKTCTTYSGTVCLNTQVVLEYQCRGVTGPQYAGVTSNW
ncbi:outer membrane lipoprotein [Cedecea neteri]|uniref:Outer membrane lipoprotein n=2 Tax=Cedecea neteri TaxID=158822 RepID=A0AAN0VV45_9ENTR|nr:outer membrane lipoprotein [Cedecea neteri]